MTGANFTRFNSFSRPHRRGVLADQVDLRTGSKHYRARRLFGHVESEHCSYKNTKIELRKFPTTGPSILVRAGEENAGVIDIGDGWAIASKWRATTIRARLNHSREPRPGLVELSATFLRWARASFSSQLSSFWTDQGDLCGRSPEPAFVSGSGSWYRSLRQLYRRTNHRRRSGVRRIVQWEPVGQCILLRNSGATIRSLAERPREWVTLFFYVGSETGRDGLAGASFASRDLTTSRRRIGPLYR